MTNVQKVNVTIRPFNLCSIVKHPIKIKTKYLKFLKQKQWKVITDSSGIIKDYDRCV